ncbi:MAG: hypothetical protein ABI905_05850 [Betaproteobacteria bacterium]
MNSNVYAEPRGYAVDPLYDRIEIIDGTLQPNDGIWNSNGLLWAVAILVALGVVAYLVNYERVVHREKITAYQYQPASSAAGTAAPAGSPAASTGKDAVPTVAVPAPAAETTGGSTGGTYPSPANPHAIGAPPPNSPVPGAANTPQTGSVPVKK